MLSGNDGYLIAHFFDAVNCGIVIVDPDTRRIIYVNNTALLMLGCDKERLIGKSCTEYFCKQTEHACPIVDNDLVLENYETFITRFDGSVIIISKTVNTIMCNGKTYLVESFVDITDLKKSEHRTHSLLKLSESRLKSEKEIAEFALTEAIKLTDSKIGYLHLINNESNGDKLDLFAYVSLDEAEAECKVPQDQYHLINHNLMWFECVNTGKPIVNNDYVNSDSKHLPHNHFSIKRHMVVPVINGDDSIVAVMGVANKNTLYTSFDIEQLQLFANSSWQIIKRKRLDRELFCSENRYRTLLEKSPAAVYEIDFADPDLKLINAGGAIGELSGYSREELLSMSAVDLLTPSSQKKFVNRVKQVLKGELVPNEVEFDVITKSGQVKRSLVKVNFTKREEDGHIIAHVVAIDITPLKILEQKARTYLEVAPSIFVILDKNGDISFINRYGMDLLECDESVFGKNWFDNFLKESDRDKVRKIFEDLAEGRTLFSSYINEVVTVNGNLRIISWRNTVLRNESGEIIEIIGAGHDITSEKLLEQRLENKWKEEEDRLRRNLKSLSIFDNTNSLGV